jgi:hypothetical protein
MGSFISEWVGGSLPSDIGGGRGTQRFGSSRALYSWYHHIDESRRVRKVTDTSVRIAAEPILELGRIARAPSFPRVLLFWFECPRDLYRIGDLLETDDAAVSHCPNVREARFELSARRSRPRRVYAESEDPVVRFKKL